MSLVAWWNEEKKRVQQIKNKRELLAYKKERKPHEGKGITAGTVSRFGTSKITVLERKKQKRKLRIHKEIEGTRIEEKQNIYVCNFFYSCCLFICHV